MSLQNSRQISDVKVLLKMGSDGAGIVDIELTSSQGNVDTYTITLSNGNKYTFNVTNGVGIDNIEKTGTQGLVDTYTITMDDGYTYDFTVTNGRDGGMSTKFVISSDAGSTVTVTTPSGTVITAEQVTGSTTEWQAETVEYGVHTITSVYGGSSQSTTVDVTEAKIYTVHLEHFIATIAVTYTNGATCTCIGSNESYTATGSPYIFTVHSADTYIITVTDGVNTKSESVIISQNGQSENITIQLSISINVTLHGAPNDTLSFTDESGQKVATLNSNGISSETLEIDPDGQNVIFESTIAKDPSNPINVYSKSALINSITTDVYIMPDNAIYWYGYTDGSIDLGANCYGKSSATGSITGSSAINTNDISVYTSENSDGYGFHGLSITRSINLSNYASLKVLCKSGATTVHLDVGLTNGAITSINNYYHTAQTVTPSWQKRETQDGSNTYMLFNLTDLTSIVNGNVGLVDWENGTSDVRIYAIYAEEV